MVIFYMKWKKYDEIQLTKNNMDLHIRNMTNHPPSPGYKRDIQSETTAVGSDNRQENFFYSNIILVSPLQ